MCERWMFIRHVALSRSAPCGPHGTALGRLMASAKNPPVETHRQLLLLMLATKMVPQTTANDKAGGLNYHVFYHI